MCFWLVPGVHISYNYQVSNNTFFFATCENLRRDVFLSPVKNILRTILPEKLSESLKSVLPDTADINLLCYMVVP